MSNYIDEARVEIVTVDYFRKLRGRSIYLKRRQAGLPGVLPLLTRRCDKRDSVVKEMAS